MPEALRFTVVDDEDPDDSLESWLTADDALRRLATPQAVPPEPGTLGAPPDVVELLLDKGGAVTVALHIALYWLRTRKSKAKLTVKKGKGSITFSGDQVADLDAKGVGDLIDRTVAALDRK